MVLKRIIDTLRASLRERDGEMPKFRVGQGVSISSGGVGVIVDVTHSLPEPSYRVFLNGRSEPFYEGQLTAAELDASPALVDADAFRCKLAALSLMSPSGTWRSPSTKAVSTIFPINTALCCGRTGPAGRATHPKAHFWSWEGPPMRFDRRGLPQRPSRRRTRPRARCARKRTFSTCRLRYDANETRRKHERTLASSLRNAKRRSVPMGRRARPRGRNRNPGLFPGGAC